MTASVRSCGQSARTKTILRLLRHAGRHGLHYTVLATRLHEPQTLVHNSCYRLFRRGVLDCDGNGTYTLTQETPSCPRPS